MIDLLVYKYKRNGSIKIYWFITRPQRKLISVPEIFSAFIAGSLNAEWTGQVGKHINFEEALEQQGLKRKGERRDQGGSRGRTYVSWLFSLGLFFKKEGKIQPTLAGEALLNGESPVEVLKQQVCIVKCSRDFTFSCCFFCNENMRVKKNEVEYLGEIHYGGKWTILNDEEKNEYEGQITINDIEGLIHLEIYHFDPLRKNMFANTLIPKNIDCINGILSNGAKVSLLDCSVYSRKAEVYSKNIISIVAKYAINGLNLNHINESLFNKVRYRLSHINDWANLNSYDSYIDPNYRYSIGYKEEDKVTMVDMQDKKVVLEPTFNVERGRDGSGSITLNKDVWVNLEYDMPRSLDESFNDVRKAINLISLGIGTQVDVLKVEVFNNSLFDTEEESKSIEHPFEVFTNFKYKERYQRVDNYYYLFSLSNLTNENSHEFSVNWFKQYSKLEPIIELFLDLYKYEMTHERAFLNLTQALETFHTRFKANTKAKYKTRIHSIVESCPPAIKEQHLNYLLSDEQERSRHILLKSRLADLFLADFQFMFMKGYKLQYEFVIKAVETRNYYTHYSENKKDKIFKDNELEEAVHMLRIVLEYHLLKEIGFTDEHIRKKMEQRFLAFENNFGPY